MDMIVGRTLDPGRYREAFHRPFTDQQYQEDLPIFRMPRATKEKRGLVADHSTSNLLIFKYEGKRVLAKQENCYRETIQACRVLFRNIPNDHTILLSTKDLENCKNEMAVISEQIWEEVVGQLNSVVVTAVERPPEVVVVKDSDRRNRKITVTVIIYCEPLQSIAVTLAPSTKISRLMDAVALKQGRERGTLKLTFDGVRIMEERTLASYNIEDGDEIDCLIEQLGGKPVIYLFSPTPIQATVKLSLAAQWDLSATYPVVPIKPRTESSNQEISWKVEVHPNGDLTELTTGLDVAYLFWEAHTNSSVARLATPPPSPGGILSTEDVDIFYPNDADLNDSDSVVLSIDKITPYLDKALTALCLHTEARTSFITYWLPSLLKHKHVALRFVSQKSYERAAPLTVSPAPDVVTRIFMVFKGVADDKLIQWSAATNRASEDVRMWRDIVGIDSERARDTSLFRVLEWGGMEVIQKS